MIRIDEEQAILGQITLNDFKIRSYTVLKALIITV